MTSKQEVYFIERFNAFQNYREPARTAAMWRLSEEIYQTANENMAEHPERAGFHSFWWQVTDQIAEEKKKKEKEKAAAPKMEFVIEEPEF